MIYPERTNANNSAWIVVVVMALLMQAWPASAADNVAYTVPSRQFFITMVERGTPPVIRQGTRNRRWRTVKNFSRESVCRLTTDGEFIAQRIHGSPEIVWCELELFAADHMLAAGWSVQRIHWRGDTKLAKFVSNPVNTAKLHVRVLLPVPRAASTGARRKNQLSLRLLTLRGPAGSQWFHALPAQ